MTTKQTYAARFGDGQIVYRHSFHSYTHAWRVRDENGIDVWSGVHFTASPETARIPRTNVYRGMTPREKRNANAAWAEKTKGWKLEIVEVEVATT